MDKTIVIFILSVIILYAALGVVASTALQGYLSNNKNTSAVNQTNSSLNVNNTTQTNSQNNLISATKAIIIVNRMYPLMVIQVLVLNYSKLYTSILFN